MYVKAHTVLWSKAAFFQLQKVYLFTKAAFFQLQKVYLFTLDKQAAHPNVEGARGS
jgi:hypothetical protein